LDIFPLLHDIAILVDFVKPPVSLIKKAAALRKFLLVRAEHREIILTPDGLDTLPILSTGDAYTTLGREGGPMAESSLIVAASVGDPLFHDHLLAIRLAKDDSVNVSDFSMVVGRFVEQLPRPQVACDEPALPS
jgi:hypothetical protein